MRRLGLALLGLVLAGIEPVGAEQPGPSADPEIKARIERILAEPPFRSERQAYRYRYTGSGFDWDWDFDRDDESEEDDPSGSPFDLGLWLGNLSQVLLWALVIGAVVVLILYRERWMNWLSLPARRARPVELPAVLFGRDEPEEPLPEDIVGRARELWRGGERRAALSVLYRGALVRLISEHRVELPASATEEDCIRAVIPRETPEVAGFFRELARTWQRAAYARRYPDDAAAEALCRAWALHFEVPGEA